MCAAEYRCTCDRYTDDRGFSEFFAQVKIAIVADAVFVCIGVSRARKGGLLSKYLVTSGAMFSFCITDLGASRCDGFVGYFVVPERIGNSTDIGIFADRADMEGVALLGASRRNYRVFVIVTVSGNGVTNIGVTAIYAGVCGIALGCAGGSGYGSAVVVRSKGSLVLRYGYGAAYRAVLTLGKSSLSAGGGDRRIGYLGVTESIGNSADKGIFAYRADMEGISLLGAGCRNYRVFVIVTVSGNGVTNIGVTAIYAGVCGIALGCAGGSGYGGVVIVSELGNRAIHVRMLTVCTGVSGISLCRAGGSGYHRNVIVTKSGGNVPDIAVATRGANVYGVSSCGAGGDNGYGIEFCVSGCGDHVLGACKRAVGAGVVHVGIVLRVAERLDYLTALIA